VCFTALVTENWITQFLKRRATYSDFPKYILNEAEKREATLERLLDVTSFLASRGLSFQDDSTKTGDVNNDNVQGILEPLARYSEIPRTYCLSPKKSVGR
jgi:hypothetical protein